jgi:hypothetical protein
MYEKVAVLDVPSMHPTSIEILNLFGPYTKNFSDLKKARVADKTRRIRSAPARCSTGALAISRPISDLGDVENADASFLCSEDRDQHGLWAHLGQVRQPVSKMCETSTTSWPSAALCS